MRKRKKRLYTFEQLDSLLRRNGRLDHSNKWWASLPGSINVQVVGYGGEQTHLQIEHWDMQTRFPIASVWSVDDGGTAYEVEGCTRAVGATREGRRLYRHYVNRFTPHTIRGPTPHYGTKYWYGLYDGVAVEITPSTESGKKPVYPSHLYPNAMVPRLRDWLGPGVEKGLPKFVARSRAFYKNLRRELDACVPATVQLLSGWQASSNASRGFTWGAEPCLFLHVCTPPTSHDRGRRLIVATEPHGSESRQFFALDGDYSFRHSQFRACEPPETEQMRWRCAQDAIVGIKEWLLGSIFIAGPE